MSPYHIPVMLNEVLEFLDVKPGSWYVDCNLGGRGHTEGILGKGGKVIGIDVDGDAIKEAAKNYDLRLMINDEGKFHVESESLILVQGNFAQIKKILTSVISSVSERSPDSINLEIPRSARNDNNNGIKIAGVFYDLGVSSYQLGTSKRGFSFNIDAPLDMRMDQSQAIPTAADLVNGLHKGELAELFWKLGEERFSRQIAKKIVEERKKSPITTTDQLARIILSVRHRGKNDRTHPATRVFQALRIAVNDELDSLKVSLPQAWEILEPGGRLVVISFHSLEDRITKDFIREIRDRREGKILTKKPVEPTESEILENPRARSGKLRVIEKL